jgi:AhpD family alkylhydroperoxidase
METLIMAAGNDLPSENLRILETLAIADQMLSGIYARPGDSAYTLGSNIGISNGVTSLSLKEKEAVNLIVSEVNGCTPCLSEHLVTALLHGFSEIEINNVRKGYSSDIKLDVMVALAKEIAKDMGGISKDTVYDFFDAGYTKNNLVDLILLVSEKSNSN